MRTKLLGVLFLMASSTLACGRSSEDTGSARSNFGAGETATASVLPVDPAMMKVLFTTPIPVRGVFGEAASVPLPELIAKRLSEGYALSVLAKPSGVGGDEAGEAVLQEVRLGFADEDGEVSEYMMFLYNATRKEVILDAEQGLSAQYAG